MTDWPEWARVLAGAVAAAAALYAVLLVVLLRSRPPDLTVRDVARLLPDVLRLVRRLAASGTVPRRCRVLAWLLLVYLVVPVDLVPDFVPVLGFADDVVIALVVLRAVVRRAGPAAVAGHWPGTPEGLRTVLRAAGVRSIGR